MSQNYEDRVTYAGKQIKLDGEHLADARSDMAAEVIAICINRAGLRVELWPPEERVKVEGYFK